MTYTPTNWTNETGEKINATNLNKIEAAIEYSSIVGGLLWVDLITYEVGTLVIDSVDGNIYTCILQHTGTGTAPSSDATNWELSQFLIAAPHTFTAPQRSNINAATDAIAFDLGNNLELTSTAATPISVASQTVGQSGTIKILTAENITGWGTEFDWGNQGIPIDLTGTEWFSYTIWAASGVDSIIIGRV